MLVRSSTSSDENGSSSSTSAGPRGERPGERDALALAARELVRQPLLEPGEPDQLEQLGDAPSISPGSRRAGRGAARSRRSPRPSGAGRARRPAGRSRCGAAPAARLLAARRRSGRRARSCPRPARSKPAIRRSSVVLPLPDAPRIAVSEPVSTSSETPLEHDPLAERLLAGRRPTTAIPTVRPAGSRRPASGDPLEPASEEQRREAWRRAAARARTGRRRRRRSRS